MLLDSCGICHFGILHLVILSRVISFLHCTLLVTLIFSLLVSVSCFRLWFLTVVSVFSTQCKPLPVPGSTIMYRFVYPACVMFQRVGTVSMRKRVTRAFVLGIIENVSMNIELTFKQAGANSSVRRKQNLTPSVQLQGWQLLGLL